MAQLLGAIATMMEKATRPPAPPVDRTLPQTPITIDNLEELTKQAKEFYKMDKPNDFHIAVVGAQGAGKSSLINGLCNRSDTQPGAATVGYSNNEARPYRNTMLEAQVFWEMPGATVGHPSATFFTDKKLYAFDLIILVSDRFQRVDFEVAKVASRLGRRFIFVRTKADLATKRIVERESAKAVTTLQVHDVFRMLRKEVEASCREGLRLCGLGDKFNPLPLYLVSTKRYLGGPNVYNVTENLSQDEEEYDDDEGGHKLDEDNLVYYLTTLLRSRAVRRTRTFARRSQANINVAS